MDYYAILGVPAEADDKAIRLAYHALARRYHPDAGAGSSSEQFRLVTEAYETLSDPARRRTYDRARPGPVPPRPPIEPIAFPAEPLAGPAPWTPVPSGRVAPFSPAADLENALFDELMALLNHPFPFFGRRR